jgi:hypothetical protein
LRNRPSKPSTGSRKRTRSIPNSNSSAPVGRSIRSATRNLK